VTTRRGTLLCAVALLWGCTTPAAPPAGQPIRTEVRLAPIVPDDADVAAADAAAAALVGDVEGTARAAATIEAFDDTRPEGPTGLEPAARDLLNAVASPGRAYHDASLELLDRPDLDPALRERIERANEADPLEIADARVREARFSSFAKLFNTIAEPIGQSILATALAPIRIARSTLRYGIDLYKADPLPVRRRQALAHWKKFLARYPDDPRHAEVKARAAEAQRRWSRTRLARTLRDAERALDQGQPREALVLADRAMRHAPEAGEKRAERVRNEAAERIHVIRRDQRESLRFALPPGHRLTPPQSRGLALALFDPRTDLERAVHAVPPGGELASEAPFVEAVGLGSTNPDAAWNELRRIAEGDGDRDNMVRHAQALLADPVRNPYDTFVEARTRDRRARTAWVFLGPAAYAERSFSLVGVLEGVLGLPSIIQSIVTLPLRVIQFPWMPPPATAKATAVQARRVLALETRGERADTVRDWLEDYERDRRNFVGALRVAESRPGVEPGDLQDLREQAARQALQVAIQEERRDMRQALLMGVTRKFPKTEAGDEAGRLARKEIEERTPHEIVLTRGFLEENPEVAGIRGLALDPALLDDDAYDSELHPDGVALIGGRVIEIRTIAAGGDEDDDPERTYVTVSEERFALIVARLEETSFRNALLDEDDPVVPDAGRDLVFERAKLGLADDVDSRATAEASFSYRGMSERYGVVRRREPVLPFDIVVRGSLADLSLGAFPRLREPKLTPDAMLYE
jgi:hypothetical protein